MTEPTGKCNVTNNRYVSDRFLFCKFRDGKVCHASGEFECIYFEKEKWTFGETCGGWI